MGIKKGTKLTENPKEKMMYVRVDSETKRKCLEISETEHISNSEVIRQGIDLKYQQMEERKNE